MPLFLAPGMLFENGRGRLAATPGANDPRAFVDLPAGPSLVTIRFPTWLSVAKWALPWTHHA